MSLAHLRKSEEPIVAGSEQYWLETEGGGDVGEGEQSQKMEALDSHGKTLGFILHDGKPPGL